MSHQISYRTRLPIKLSRGVDGSHDLYAAGQRLHMSQGKKFPGVYLEIFQDSWRWLFQGKLVPKSLYGATLYGVLRLCT